MSGLNADFEEKQGHTCMYLTGEIGLSEEYKFRQTVQEALNKNPAHLVINLKGIALLSSYGIAAIVNVWKQIHSKGGKLSIICPNNHIYDCLAIAGTDKIIDIYKSEEELFGKV